jgi:uncharacterized protein YheU (UPF0270 family)
MKIRAYHTKIFIIFLCSSISLCSSCFLDSTANDIKKKNNNRNLYLILLNAVLPFEMISPEGTDAYVPQVAKNQNTTLIVWAQDFGNSKAIYLSECRNGTWKHPAALYDHISPNGSKADAPHVAMDSAGNAVVVWEQMNGSVSCILKSEYRNGSWVHPSSATQYINPGSTSAHKPIAAMDDLGNAIIVWEQSDGSHTRIYKSEYRAGAWSHPVILLNSISPDGTPAQNPRVVMNNQGEAIITWEQTDGIVSRIFKSDYRNNAWNNPSSLSDNISPDGTDATLPQAAMDDNGNAVIVWQQSDHYYSQIFMSEYRGNAWQHPANLNNNVSPDGTSAQNPQVVMNRKGEAIITWEQNDGSASQIFKSEYRNSAWNHPANLSDNISPDDSGNFEPKAAMDNAGNAIIVWKQIRYTDFFHDSFSVLLKSEYRNGTWAHSNNSINPIGPTDNFGRPSGAWDYVTALCNSKVLLVWVQGDGEDGRICKSEF